MANADFQPPVLYKQDHPNYWLKVNGLDPKTFHVDELHIVQARKIATNLLKNNSKLLGQNQAQTLNNFLKAKTKTITLKQCYSVMNIGTQINRKLYKIKAKSKKR